MQTINRNKIIKIIYLGLSIAISVLITVLLSNLYWLDTKLNKIPHFSYDAVQPYSQVDTQSRFAINELNQKLEYIVLSISATSQDYEVSVHYQANRNDEYLAIAPTFISSDGVTTQYHFSSNDTVENFYVDLNGSFTQTPTISVKTKEAKLTLSIPAVVFGISIFMLFIVIYRLRSFFIDIYQNREIIKILIINDLRSRYAGSFFGIMWSFVQPILTILVFWFVFQLGFKSPPVQDIPYILWFIPAYIPWMYFQDVVINATGCLREYSYLVKKMKFKVDILPVIKVISSLIIHFCFILFMFFAYGVYGIKPTLLYLQLIYYSFAMAFMVCGLSWLIASLSVFMKDFSQIVAIILQLGYFAIPVFWTEDMMDPAVLTILKLNPIYYIVQGYRDCMNGQLLFWNYPWLTVYFWIFSIAVFWLGITLFDRVKKHFADLL